MGNDFLANSLSPVITISIHVPAWGTTLRTLELMSILRFQSTFPRGERPRKDTVRFILDNFNPRSRVGNDNCRTKRRRVCARFQSTFPRGERLLLRRRCLKNSVFQSTFPRGERHWSHNQPANDRNFNPRSRVGNDGLKLCLVPVQKISIHVPAWGTTEIVVPSGCFHSFQSTFPRGERPVSKTYVTTTTYISIHVPAWGTTSREPSAVLQ